MTPVSRAAAGRWRCRQDRVDHGEALREHRVGLAQLGGQGVEVGLAGGDGGGKALDHRREQRDLFGGATPLDRVAVGQHVLHRGGKAAQENTTAGRRVRRRPQHRRQAMNPLFDLVRRGVVSASDAGAVIADRELAGLDGLLGEAIRLAAPSGGGDRWPVIARLVLAAFDGGGVRALMRDHPDHAAALQDAVAARLRRLTDGPLAG